MRRAVLVDSVEVGNLGADGGSRFRGRLARKAAHKKDAKRESPHTLHTSRDTAYFTGTSNTTSQYCSD